MFGTFPIIFLGGTMSCRFVTIFCFLTSLISRSGERAIQAEGAQKCVYITELTRHVISAQVLSQGRNMQDYLDLDLTPQSLNSGGGLCEFFNQPLQLCWRNRDLCPRFCLWHCAVSQTSSYLWEYMKVKHAACHSPL